MIIDTSHPEETRVVVTKGSRLEEFDFESQHKRQIRGNIYLAKVTRVEPSLQAAFVDYGGNRHGFLAFSEIHPDYYQIPLADRQALVEEEARLAESEFADEAEPAGNGHANGNGNGNGGRARKGRRRRSGGNDRRDGRDQNASKDAAASANVPDAEPVAMDAYIAAWEAAQASAKAEDGEPATIAAAHDAGDKVSEAATHAFAASDDDDDDADDSDHDGNEEEEVIDDVGEDDAIEESRPRKRLARRQYKIQEVIKRRQVILVQVVKEERGNKGAALTTYLSLAGRYSVLMPNTARGGGISRKITSAGDRKRLKDLVKDLDVPQGMGVILRTAGASRTPQEIERDYEYLMRLWDSVRDLTLASTAPALVYEEGSLIKRSIRDLYNKDIGEIVVAGEEGYREARDFMKMLMPDQVKMVKRWDDTAPILARTGIEAQLDKLIQPQVTLKSGGYIIINQTEALVAIDVNSGKSTREHSIEETALATNLEAAEEVARQLRLRDLAGLIVIDFIDMEEGRNNRSVEKKLKDCLKNDRARIQLGRISHFGLMEMSRQRMRASVLESTMQICSHCGGTGHVRSPQSVALHLIRSLEDWLLRNPRTHVTVRTSGDTAMYVLNNKRDTLADMEERFGVRITVSIDNTTGAEMFAIDRGAVAEVVERRPATGAVGIGRASDDDDDDDGDDAGVQTTLAVAETGSVADAVDDDEDDSDGIAAPAEAEEAGDDRSRRRRRRRRGGRDRDREGDRAAPPVHAAMTNANAAEDDDSDEIEGSDDDEDEADGVAAEGNGDAKDGRKRRRRSRGRRGGKNRRERVSLTPDAEPVGPLADLVASGAFDTPASEALAEDDTIAEPEVLDVDTAVAVVEAAVEPAPEAAAEIPEPVAAVVIEAPEVEPTAAPKRARATASTIKLDVEPVVVSTAADADKPKRGGWWAKGKGFFG